MMKRLLSILLVLLGLQAAAFSQATGELKGTVKDDKGEPVPFASVSVEMNGKQVTGQAADIDGKFWIKGINTGNYTVKVSSVGMNTSSFENVVIRTGDITVLDPKMESGDGVNIKEVKVDANRLAIKKGSTTEGSEFTHDQLMKVPTTTTLGVVAVTAGVLSRNGSYANFQGSRQAATVFVDGVKVRGGSANIPRQGAESVKTILGGVPAKYGDATGGIIEITTRNIANDYFGAVEGRTSQFLDNYGHYYFSGVFGGPIVKRKQSSGGKPIAGILLAVEGQYDKDPFPGAGGWYNANNETRNRIITDPIKLPPAGQSGTRLNAEYLQSGDFTKTAYRQNAAQQFINANAKIDINPAKNTYIAVGGYFNASQNMLWDYNNSMFNWDQNGRQQAITWNVYGRFTQYFDGKKDANGKYKGLKNAMINLQVDYLKGYSKTEDVRHENRLFNYGYVGKFDVHRTPTYVYGYDTTLNMSGFLYSGMRDTLVSFTPSDVNSQISAVTSQFYSLYPTAPGHYDQLSSLINNGGIINGRSPRQIYDLFNSPGTPYNGYGITDNNQFRINFTGTATIGDHDLGLGFEFEQRTDASYSIGPVGLWTIARQLTNAHLGTIDPASATAVYNGTGVYQDTINYNPLFIQDSSAAGQQYGFGRGQSLFDYNLRTKLGLATNGTDYINVDALDPNFLSLDMFSVDELYNQGANLVTNFGYDVYGNRFTGNANIVDFFSATDKYGRNTRPIAAFQPIYMAGYIQDRFSFKDIYFNVGVRVDRYDANQSVLKDRYSLYDTRKAGDINFQAMGDGNYQKPGNVEDDWVVYVADVNDPNANYPVGYRDGDTWYNAQGQVINDPSVLRNSSGRTQPYLVDNSTVDKPGPGLYNAFTDYTPQVNVMPRISFAFPIGDNTQFTAYYDVLTQRPGNSRLNPLDYLYWDNGTYNSGGTVFNNPNLRPERTTDFALSFQQKISEAVMFKIKAFYRELRDMIAVVKVAEAFPRSYSSYSNIDFGTVKGLTAEIQLAPQSGNLNVVASYTLQFADGTGSNNTSQLNLVNSGQPNLRTTMPLNYDSRHQFKLFGVFNFGDLQDKNPQSAKYLGPKGKFFEAIFRNLGVSMTLYGNSGLPYSRQILPTPTQLGGASGSLQGSLNGARLPFEFYNDFMFTKDINLFFGKKKENSTSRKKASLQLYITIQNMFDVRNIIGVYAATGSPTDDGYLTSPLYQSQILSQVDPQSFINYYNMKVATPYNYSLPRTVRLGAILGF